MIAQKLRRALVDVLDTPRANEDDLNYTLSIGVAEFIMGEDVLAWRDVRMKRCTKPSAAAGIASPSTRLHQHRRAFALPRDHAW